MQIADVWETLVWRNDYRINLDGTWSREIWIQIMTMPFTNGKCLPPWQKGKNVPKSAYLLVLPGVLIDSYLFIHSTNLIRSVLHGGEEKKQHCVVKISYC